jgi:epoxyqueuosine reductase QueG
LEFINEFEMNLKHSGASLVGYSNVYNNLPENLKELKFAITIIVRLSDFIIDEIKDKPTFTYFHHFRTVNALIDQITLKGLLMIQEKGYKVLAVPASQTVNGLEDKYSGIFPHKTAAVKAGLGWMGKSGLFISSKYGPRVRLGTILTNMEIPCNNSIMSEQCGECKRCVESCPAMALSGNAWTEDCSRGDIVDAKACSDYMNSRFKHIGRGSVCGICMKVCPQSDINNINL